MGFVDYIKKMMDQKVNTTNLMTGEPDRRTVGQRLRAGGEWIPGPSDVISGYDAWEAFKKGNYGEAALNAVGTLPLVPALGGVIRKSSESMVPKFSYDEEPYKYDHLSPEEIAVNRTLDVMNHKWAKAAGSESDPFYKLIEEGKINSENMDDVFGNSTIIQDAVDSRKGFASILDRLGGYSGQYDEKKLPHWTKQLENWRDELDLPPMGGTGDAKMIGNLYDTHLIAPREWGFEGKFNAKQDVEDEWDNFANNLSEKERKFYDKLGDQDLVGIELNRLDPEAMPIFADVGEKALMHALKTGSLNVSSLADNRVSLPGLIDFIQQHRDFQLKEGAKTPPEDILNTFPSGHRWEELKNEDQLKLEGDVMSHCVGGYCDKIKKGDARIFSLRNAEGKPKITAEWDPRSRTFEQIMGPGNSNPKDKYRDMIDWLIEKSIDW